MILLDNSQLIFNGATQVASLNQHYFPANIMITKTTGDVGSLTRMPVRIRIERGGFILMAVLSLNKIDNWFNKRREYIVELLTHGAVQSWIVIAGVAEGNLFGTINDTSINVDDFNNWLTETRMSGCIVSTVKDYSELETLCATVDAILINNGPVLDVLSIDTLLSTIPHVGPIADTVTAYCGNIWSSLSFLTNKDLFNTLPASPQARLALGNGYFTREMHTTVREFFGLELDDYGLGLYLNEN